MEMGVTAVMLPELDFDEQVALCRELGIRYYQYRPRVIPPEQRDKPWGNWGNHKFDLTPERLAKEGAALTRRLRDAGMEPWGTVPTLTVDAPDDAIRLHLEGAAAAEAKCIRCGPPGYPREPFDYPELLKRVVARYAEVIEKLSAPMGIKLILETHCGTMITSPGLAWNVVRNFPSGRIGVIFDMANFGREGEVNPVLAVSVLRDYIDCCHIGGNRRVIVDVDPLGCKRLSGQMCRMEEGDLHLPSWVKALHGAGLNPPLIIEDFTPNMSGADRLRQSAVALRRMLAAL
ncbi:MAG TPA: sugar phosphate isomerase/epimerase [Planctomycetota bacterium]|nr:sugar phosphate isomerase/epimerase [Planctomycetota bacterium]